MEQNDIVTKNFESYADVAADIINALIHNGTQEIKSENRQRQKAFMQIERTYYTIN